MLRSPLSITSAAACRHRELQWSVMQNKSCHWNVSVFLLSNICLAYKETRSITQCSQAKTYCVLHWLLFENDTMGSQQAGVSILWRFSLLCVNRAADKSQTALRNTWEKKHITFILCITASETFLDFDPLKRSYVSSVGHISLSKIWILLILTNPVINVADDEEILRQINLIEILGHEPLIYINPVTRVWFSYFDPHFLISFTLMTERISSSQVKRKQYGGGCDSVSVISVFDM